MTSTRIIYFTVAFFCAALFLALTYYVRSNPLNAYDIWFTQNIQAQAWLKPLAVTNGVIKEPAFRIIYPLLAGIFLLMKRYTFSLAVIASFASEIPTWFIKLTVGRLRPTQEIADLLDISTGLSYISGHTLEYTLLFGVLGFYVLSNVKPATLRYIGAGLLFSLPFLVGLGRIYAGAHWFTDVIGSYLFGGALYFAVLGARESAFRLKRGIMAKLPHSLIAVLIATLLVIPACAPQKAGERPPKSETSLAATTWKTYDHGDFIFSYPGEWVLNTKPALNLSRVDEGVVSLNSFGKGDFWAKTFAGKTYSYRSPAYIAKQLPENGVYFEIVKEAGARGRLRPTHTGYSDIRVMTSADYRKEISELQKHVRDEATGAEAYAEDIGRELTDRKWLQYSVEFTTSETRYMFNAILVDRAIEEQSRLTRNILLSLMVDKNRDE